MDGPMNTMTIQNTITQTPTFPGKESCIRRRGGASGNSSNCVVPPDVSI